MLTSQPESSTVPAAPAGTSSTGASPRGESQARRFRLSPYLLGYSMGPAALVAILLLRRFGLVAREPVGLWIGVFVAIPIASIGLDVVYRLAPIRPCLHARIAVHVAAVTTVIYLSGWGPVLTGAFAFVALENVAHDGSETWRITAPWSLAGIAVGQLAIWRGWAPSFLPVPRGEALALLGVFVLVFVIRMAGATMEQKEEAERSLRRSEDRFRSLVQNSSDTTLVIGEGRLITYASPATVSLLGRQPEEIVGRPDKELLHPDDTELVEVQLADRLQSADVTEPIQFRMKHADGTWRDVEAVVSDLRGRPSVAGFVANVRDITERKQAESLLAYQALHDPLTGLPNRTLILDRCEQMLARSRRDHLPVAALFIDLDNFKDINDTLGHEAGDKLLRAVAARFVAILRPSDTVGRLGGDEFVVLADGVSLAAGPELVAQRLQDVLVEPFRIEGFEHLPLTVSASVGIASGSREGAHVLLKDADIAVYRAKAQGKNCIVCFEPQMQSDVLDRLELGMDLRSALEHNQFFLLYQPVFDLDEVTLCGVEALLRWRHPSRGVVDPDEFVPMLEETGMILDVGHWVLDEACAQAAKWHRQGYTPTMSVNVSMMQLASDVFIEQVDLALTSSGLDPHFLILEITETMLMRDADATAGRLARLKTLGVRVAIDDFGTGYSSLAYLRQFPIDALKIDRSFIAAMDDSAESRALLHTLVELGRALGLETLAEGIEEQSQLHTLQQERCERGQGFLFSKPVEPAAVEALLFRSPPPADRGSPAAATKAYTAVGSSPTTKS
jgi:diguanylate cyclase (GGDEF)-like protein/PAS domain S-box-containing protein